MVKEILKAGAWGLLLLIMLITIVTASYFAYARVTGFYTDSLILEYKNTLNSTEVLLNDFNEYVWKKSYDKNWTGYGDSVAQNYINEIENKISTHCPNCNINILMPKNGFDVALIRLDLEIKSNVKYTTRGNTYNAFLLAMAILSFAICTYIIIALTKFRKLTATGLSTLVLLCVPFLLASTVLMVVHSDFSFDIGQNSIYILFGSLAYLFIVYPIIFSISKNKNYSLSNIIKLTGYKHSQT